MKGKAMIPWGDNPQWQKFGDEGQPTFVQLLLQSLFEEQVRPGDKVLDVEIQVEGNLTGEHHG